MTVLDSASRSRPAFGLLLLCLVAAAIDGVDLQILAMLVPKIGADWDTPLGAFGAIYSASTAGLIVGTLVLVGCASRYGRKPVIVFAICWVGICTMLMAITTSLNQLLILRFANCFGLGGIFPLLVIVAHDAASEKWRALSVTTVYSGIPVGGFLAGILVSLWLPRFSWQSALVISGATTLLVGLAFAFFRVPEPQQAQSSLSTHPDPGSQYVRLFAPHRRTITILLWIMFAAGLVMTYNLSNWLPSILTRSGVSTSEAAFVVSLLNLGSIIGGPLVGAFLQRYGSVAIVASALLAAGMIAVLGFSLRDPLLAPAFSFFVGIMIGGTYASTNALAASAYQPDLRAAAVGTAQVFGRIWVVIASLVVGAAMIGGAANSTLLMLSAIAALIVAAAAWALRSRSAS